jgi:hypothetical protein
VSHPEDAASKGPASSLLFKQSIEYAEAELRRLTLIDSWLSRQLGDPLAIEASIAVRRATVERELRALAEEWPDADKLDLEVTFDCGYRNGLIVEMLKIWKEELPRFTEQQLRQTGGSVFSISLVIESVLADKLHNIRLTDKDLELVSRQLETDQSWDSWLSKIH